MKTKLELRSLSAFEWSEDLTRLPRGAGSTAGCYHASHNDFWAVIGRLAS